MESQTVNIINIPSLGEVSRLSEAEITALVDRYIINIRKADKNEPPHNNLLGFFELVQNAIEARQDADNVPKSKRLLVLAHDPPDEDEIDTESITFFLKNRKPGSYSQGSPGQAKVRELVPHQRSIVQHPEHPGEKLVTMGRRFDNTVNFSIYARNDMTALKRMLWFENVMDSFKWYFRIHGIYNVIEMSVGDKERVTIGELGLTRYPMSYFVMTEDIYQFGSQELKKVELDVGLVINN